MFRMCVGWTRFILRMTMRRRGRSRCNREFGWMCSLFKVCIHSPFEFKRACRIQVLARCTFFFPWWSCWTACSICSNMRTGLVSVWNLAVIPFVLLPGMLGMPAAAGQPIFWLWHRGNRHCQRNLLRSADGDPPASHTDTWSITSSRKQIRRRKIGRIKRPEKWQFLLAEHCGAKQSLGLSNNCESRPRTSEGLRQRSPCRPLVPRLCWGRAAVGRVCGGLFWWWWCVVGVRWQRLVCGVRIWPVLLANLLRQWTHKEHIVQSGGTAVCVSSRVASCRPSEQCMQSVTCRSRSIRQWEGKVVLRETHSQMTVFHPSWPSAWRNLWSCPFPLSVTREHFDTIHWRSATRSQGPSVQKKCRCTDGFSQRGWCVHRRATYHTDGWYLGPEAHQRINVHVFLAVPVVNSVPVTHLAKSARHNSRNWFFFAGLWSRHSSP